MKATLHMGRVSIYAHSKTMAEKLVSSQADPLRQSMFSIRTDMLTSKSNNY